MKLNIFKLCNFRADYNQYTNSIDIRWGGLEGIMSRVILKISETHHVEWCSLARFAIFQENTLLEFWGKWGMPWALAKPSGCHIEENLRETE